MPEPVEVPTVSLEPETKNEVAENTADPEVLFAKGKRNLLCGETQKAVNLLQEASRLQAQKHGELADACAESYYLYGVALLELSRMESGVLGNALQGITTQEAGDAEEKESEEDKQFTEQDNYTEAEKEKISDEVIDAMLEQPSEKSDNDSAEKKEEESSTNGEQTESAADKTEESSVEPVVGIESEDKKPATETEAESSKVATTDEAGGSAEAADKEEGGAESMEEEEEEEADEAEEELDVDEAGNIAADADKSTATEDEDEVSNLQVAWEMLELAKNIYKKHDSSEMKLKHADCLLKLGEIGIESEQYKQAVEDISECLRLQIDAGITSSDRRLAETHYQLGLAYSHANQYSDALTNFRKAVDIVQSRITKLTNETAESSHAKAEEMVAENEKSNEAGEKKEANGEPDETLKQMTEELNELRALIPEIMNKIEDAEEDLRNADKVKAVISEEASGSTEIGFQSSSCSTQDSSDKDDKPVTDVSHLVRRKRKPDDEEEDDSKPENSDDAKKLKTSEDCADTTAADTPAAAVSNETAAAASEANAAAAPADESTAADEISASTATSSESVDSAAAESEIISGDSEMAPVADNEQPVAAVTDEVVQDHKPAVNENEAGKEVSASEDQTEQMNVDTVVDNATPSAE